MIQIGFDVGGTNIKAGVVDDNMKILAQRNAPFLKGGDYIKVAELMADMVRDMAKELSVEISEFQSIGIAIAGSIDAAGTTILDAHNLSFHNVPMKEVMSRLFPGIPVYLGNDANAAALAELYAGAFRGCKTAVLLTLGTGVGGGIILGGRMFNGGTGNGVELGHMVIQDGGPLCTCGNRGCIEALCTATWLTSQGRTSVVELPIGMIYQESKGNMDNVTAKMVIDCAKAGDNIALDIFNRYVDHLSTAIISCIALLDPEVVALGGGVSLAGDFLFEPVRAQVEKKSFFKLPHKVVPAQLGNTAGIIGAAMLKRNEEEAV